MTQNIILYTESKTLLSPTSSFGVPMSSPPAYKIIVEPAKRTPTMVDKGAQVDIPEVATIITSRPSTASSSSLSPTAKADKDFPQELAIADSPAKLLLKEEKAEETQDEDKKKSSMDFMLNRLDR